MLSPYDLDQQSPKKSQLKNELSGAEKYKLLKHLDQPLGTRYNFPSNFEGKQLRKFLSL